MVQGEARISRRANGSVGSGHPWWILWEGRGQGNLGF